MKFTFCICTYNSALYILDTLESIKYQIEKYGEGISVYLVASDDASEDNTAYILNKWIQSNAFLFRDVKILLHDINRGISFNYSEILLNVQTEYFLKIDGDDVISSENIFNKCFNISKDEMRVFFPICFNDSSVYIIENQKDNILYYLKRQSTHKSDLHLFETLKPFITPEVITTKSNYSLECIDFIKEFSQFEDDTSLYYVLKHNTNMIIKFSLEPLVLYRVHNRSLSNGMTSMHQIVFLDDLHKFKKYLLMNENNIICKLFLLTAVWDTFLMKHRFSANNCLHRKITKKVQDRHMREVHNKKDYERNNELLNDIIQRESMYLDEIRKKAEEFNCLILQEN